MSILKPIFTFTMKEVTKVYCSYLFEKQRSIVLIYLRNKGLLFLFIRETKVYCSYLFEKQRSIVLIYSRNKGLLFLFIRETKVYCSQLSVK